MYTEDEQQAVKRMKQLDDDLNLLFRTGLVIWEVLKLAAGAISILVTALFCIGLILTLVGLVIWALVAFRT